MRKLDLPDAHGDRPLRDFVTAIRSVDASYTSLYQINIDQAQMKNKVLPTLKQAIALFHQNLIRHRLMGKSASYTAFATF
jgi:hypothetical protein